METLLQYVGPVRHSWVMIYCSDLAGQQGYLNKTLNYVPNGRQLSHLTSAKSC